MGAPMARRLLAGGHRVRVFNRTRAKASPLETAGASVAKDPAGAAAGAELVFIMVPDTPDVESVVAAIDPVLKSGQTVIDMSTISPASERATATKLAQRGVAYLDAPVSGGEPGAIEGTLTIMVGGDAAA